MTIEHFAFVSCVSFKRDAYLVHPVGWHRCTLPKYHAGEHRCTCGAWWDLRDEQEPGS